MKLMFIAGCILLSVGCKLTQTTPSKSHQFSSEKKLEILTSYIPSLVGHNQFNFPAPARGYTEPDPSSSSIELAMWVPVKVTNLSNKNSKFAKIRYFDSSNLAKEIYVSITDLKYNIRMYADKDTPVFSARTHSKIGTINKNHAAIDILNLVNMSDDFVEVEVHNQSNGNSSIIFANPDSEDNANKLHMRLTDLKKANQIQGMAALNIKDIKGKSISAPSPMNIAKYVVLTMDEGLENYIVNFYKIMHTINLSEKNKNKTELIVVAPKYLKSLILSGLTNIVEYSTDNLKKRIRDAVDIPIQEDIPWLRFETKIDTSHPWTQDTTQQIFINGQQPALLNLHKYFDAKFPFTPIISSLYTSINYPAVEIGNIPEDQMGWAAGEGGNIDGTPDGHFIIGKNFPWPFKEALRHLDSGLVEVDVDFLQVSHIDLVYSFVPSTKSHCGYALLVNDPLVLFQEILSNNTNLPNSYARYNSDDISKFLNQDAQAPYNIESFNLNFVPNNIIQWQILENLKIHRRISSGLEKIKAGLNCQLAEDSIVKLPQLFLTEEIPEDLGSATNSYFSPITYYINHANINGNMIVPSMNAATDEDFVRRISPVLEKNKIHFINAGDFISQQGGVHCSSLVLRSHERL
ncbi:MAG: protein-arginine deiminase family protein [Bdellovibrionota bacterium]